MSPHWVLFDRGFATGQMHLLWRDKGGGAGLSRHMQIVDGQGRPTDGFARLWRAEFPTRDELPDVIATPEGKPTMRFIEVFR